MLVSLNSPSVNPTTPLSTSHATAINAVNPTASMAGGDTSLPTVATASEAVPRLGENAEAPQSAATSASEQLARLGVSISSQRVEIDPFKIGAPN